MGHSPPLPGPEIAWGVPGLSRVGAPITLKPLALPKVRTPGQTNVSLGNLRPLAQPCRSLPPSVALLLKQVEGQVPEYTQFFRRQLPAQVRPHLV